VEALGHDTCSGDGGSGLRSACRQATHRQRSVAAGQSDAGSARGACAMHQQSALLCPAAGAQRLSSPQRGHWLARLG
ncbi:MAG TPA: hypothetical protein VL027_04875, partial [Spongiibacteraceae bacterium]|nr:hypothetical protein [Spongiibacteraceae bacterium]